MYGEEPVLLAYVGEHGGTAHSHEGQCAGQQDHRTFHVQAVDDA